MFLICLLMWEIWTFHYFGPYRAEPDCVAPLLALARLDEAATRRARDNATALATRPEVMKPPNFPHKRTNVEHHAAWLSSAGAGLSGLNPSVFFVMLFSAPQM